MLGLHRCGMRRSRRPCPSGSRSRCRSTRRRRPRRGARPPCTPPSSPGTRAASSSESGSTIANSSSSPTVKSWEASKISLARPRSSPESSLIARPATRLGQVEVERVEKVDGGARRVHGHLGRHLKELLRVVEDDPHAGLDEPVRNVLRGVVGHREDPDDDLLLRDDAVELGEIEDRDTLDLGARRPRSRCRKRRRSGTRGRRRCPSPRSPGRGDRRRTARCGAGPRSA